MAYLPFNTKDDDQRALGGQPQAVTSSAGGAAPEAGPAGAQPGPVQATVASSYPMITDYLRANRGAGESMAKDVAGRIGTEVGNVKGQADAAKTDWTNANQASIDAWKKSVSDTQKQNTDAYNAYIDKVRDVGRYRVVEAPTAAEMPTAPELTAYYTPQAVTQGAAGLNSQIQALGSTAGREALLGGVYGGRAYAPGAASLDAALLGSANPQSSLVGQYGDILKALSGSPDALPVETDTSTYGKGVLKEFPRPRGSTTRGFW